MKFESSVDHNAVRTRLIEAAIHAGAKAGPSAITNKMIAQEAGLQEIYIYRYFADKRDLVTKAFFSADSHFFATMTDLFSILETGEGTTHERWRKFFDTAYEYMTSDPRYCSFYIQFYYSELFDADAKAEHMKNSRVLREKFCSLLKPGVDADVVGHHFWLFTLSYVMEVINDSSKSEKDYIDRIYKLYFDCMKYYTIE